MTDTLSLLPARDEIFQLLVRYAHGLDLRDGEMLASVFADPFEFDMSEFVPMPAAQMTPGAFVAMTLQALTGLKTLHQITNPRIEVAGDEATGMFTMAAYHHRPALAADNEYVMRGFYAEEFRKVGGQWKIVRHRLLQSYCSGNPKVMAA